MDRKAAVWQTDSFPKTEREGYEEERRHSGLPPLSLQKKRRERKKEEGQSSPCRCIGNTPPAFCMDGILIKGGKVCHHTEGTLSLVRSSFLFGRPVLPKDLTLRIEDARLRVHHIISHADDVRLKYLDSPNGRVVSYPGGRGLKPSLQ